MSVSFHGLEFEHLGHASVRIETGDGTVIYIDQWSNVYEETPSDGEVVLVTHNDFDHCDPDAIEAVAAPDATVAVYEAVDTSDLDRDVVDLPYDGDVDVAGIPITTVLAYNQPDGDHLDEDGEPFHDVQEVIGLVLEIDGVTIYFPSDTDFVSELESVSADVFIPPIGGHYTMDRHEAAAFARSVDPELVLPVHYDTFDVIETDAEAFADELESDGIRVELF
jgi:L-ascorbate metabolism protein UlaG (beta-lactamase superfamily)